MKFIESKYCRELGYSKLDYKYGDIYLLDKFIIAEIYEGVHLDWNKTKEFAEKLIQYYGLGIKVGYVSNRVNSYSIDPQSWERTEKTYNLLVAATIVTYTEVGLLNASLEKHFSKNSIKHCQSLNEAIEWIKNLREFN